MVRTRALRSVGREAHEIDAPEVDAHEIDAHEIEVYATGTTIITGPEDEWSGPDGVTPVGDHLRRAVTVLHDGLDHARRFHAKAGPRMGPHPAAVASTRQGSRSEIIRPVLLDPWYAWEVAGSGQLFAEPIARLRIDRGQNTSQTTYPSWRASLRTGWLTRRSAKLQVSASPSFNVTVLELIPASPRRTGNRSFLRVGLPAIEEIARRLEGTRARAIGCDAEAGALRGASPRSVVSPGCARDW